MKTTTLILISLIIHQISVCQSSVWVNIGPFGIPNPINGSFIDGNGNGRICAITLQEGSNLIWAASPRGPVWSKDFTSLTNNWEPVFLSYLWNRCGVSTIAVDSFNPDNILVGTGENESPFMGFSKRFSSIGIFKSSDGGAIFTSTSLSYTNPDSDFSDQFKSNESNGTRISKIVYDPYTEGKVYAIVRRLPGGQNYDIGSGEIYISTNGGEDWDIFVMSGISQPDKYFWDLEIKPGGDYENTTIYVSSPNPDDLTLTYNIIHDDVMTIEVDPNDASGLIVYAGTDGGVFRSSDGGAHFVDVNQGLCVSETFDLSYSPKSKRIVIGSQDVYSHIFDEGEWERILPSSHDGSNTLINFENPDIFYTSDYQCENPPTCDQFGDIFYNELNPAIPAGMNYAELGNNAGAERRIFPNQIAMTMAPDDADVIYAGYGTLRKSISGGGALFKLEPHPGIPTDSNSILSIAVSQSNSNIIYITTVGYWSDLSGNPSTDWNNVNYYKRLELFVHYNGGVDAAGYDWIDVSPHLVGVDEFITSVIVSPTDPNKIWITFNDWLDNNGNQENIYIGVRNPTTNVWTWSNYSNGLPKAPTNKVIYQIGSNDKLFIAVDGDDYKTGGVYYRDNSMSSWVEYGGLLPHSLIMDIEIDYCSGKIGAATFGSGIWEAKLPEVISALKIEINSNTSWTVDKDIFQDVVIKSGSTLTISSGAVINMGSNRRITVERGARLIEDGATLTNLCGAMWKGIEVWGYDNLIHPSIISVLSGSYPASGSDHGVVLIKGNSLIENSNNGISTSKYNDVGWSDPEYHGGIIVALASTFKNNKRSIEFLSFANENISEFIGCTFLTDDNLNEGLLPNSHVTMWAVKGVLFMSNTFENNLPYGPKQGIKRGKGIYSEEATYDVLRVCITPVLPCGCSEWEGNTFKELYRGIEARSIGVDFKFTKAIYGAWSRGIYFIQIKAEKQIIGNQKIVFQ